MSSSAINGSGFTRSTKVIAVADVVESVRLMERGEHEFIGRWHRFVNFVQDQVQRDTGRLHKSLGDGLMLEFSDPHGCIRAAMAMQAWFRDVNEALPPAEHVHLRIGAHIADFVADKYDIYGTDVNLATRIASLAGPGEIVISSALRERLRGALPLPLEDLGSCHLKHVKEPVHAFRLGRAGRAPVIAAPPLEAPGLRATIAVLPFATRGDSLDGVGGETVADELVTVLARSDLLQVVSRMTTAALDASRDTLATVLSEVNARYVLTGRARQVDGALALFAELADARSAHVLWAESFQGAARPGSGVDARMIADTVAALHAAVVRHEIEQSAGRAMPSLQGATLLLAALGLMHRLSPVDMGHAQDMLEHLSDRWRRHATAHAWLGHLHVLRVQQAGAGIVAPDQALARAHAAAAVQYDPASPLVLALDGHAYLHGARNLQGAEDRYAQALSVRQDHSLALLFRSELLSIQGHGRAARAAAGRATHSLSLEPLRFLYDSLSALAALVDNDADAASMLAQQALDRNPRYLPAWHTLIVSQVESERLGEARASQQRLIRRNPAFSVRGFLKATHFQDELARRFCDAFISAGAPQG
jgi:class 3 adenylate cyclase/tetratricopeptide (TPR) repeat protein